MSARLLEDESPVPPAVTFVAPVDPLVAPRRQLQELFDFEYRWEIFTPEPKRQFGYYVLPILFGDRIVGRIEPRFDKTDKAAGALRILGIWWEKGFNPRIGSRVRTGSARRLCRLPRLHRRQAGRLAAGAFVGRSIGRSGQAFVALSIASTVASASASVVIQFETLMRMAAMPCQVVPPIQAVPSA